MTFQPPPPHTFVVPLEPPGRNASYESGYANDVVRWGIGLGQNIEDSSFGPGFYMTPTGLARKVVVDDGSLAGIPASTQRAAATPQNIAAGGHNVPAASLPHSLQSVPIMTPTSAAPSTTPAPGPRSDRVGASAVAFDRLLRVEPVGVDELRPLLEPYGGLTAAFQVSVPENLSGTHRPNWLPIWTTPMTLTDGATKTWNFLVDSAAGDTWTWCDMDFAATSKMPGKGNWENQRYRPLYERKSRIPAPPQWHIDNINYQAEIGYGDTSTQNPYPCSLLLTQTMIKLVSLDGRGEIPMTAGAAIGFSPTILCTTRDGILGLGRTLARCSYFGPSARWETETFVEVLKARGMIEQLVFYVYISHPYYDRATAFSNYISFGSSWNTGLVPPPGPFVAVDVDNSAETQGKWCVLLEKIYFQSATPGSAPESLIDAHQDPFLVCVDTGSSNSWFPRPVYNKFNALNIKYGAAGEGSAGNFSKDDKIIFQFRGAVYGTVQVTAQARRFLISPMRSHASPAHASPIRRVHSGEESILGVNFFRAVIVGFDEGQITPRLAFSPQPFL